MADYQGIFQRYEKKYLLSSRQYSLLTEILKQHIVPDEQYPHSTILNTYFDTPDYRLIRRSIEKPNYKEKLRLRCYSIPGEDTPVFCELKKKCGGVVYKRRAGMTYRDAMDFLYRGVIPENASQIEKEIKWFLDFYPGIRPAVCLCYDRDSFAGDSRDPGLRITFDRNIRWRNADADLTRGSCGDALLKADGVLMEIKMPSAMPLWLSETLGSLAIYPTGFSKYGTAYRSLMQQNDNHFMGGVFCA